MPDEAVPEQELQAARAERDAWGQEAFESHRFAAALAVERQALADALARAEARIHADADSKVQAAWAERDRAFTERDAAFAERDQARVAQRAAEAMLAQVTGSTAWRVTAPLRHGLMLLLGRPR